VHATIDGVVKELSAVHELLEQHAAGRDIALLAVGVDPENGADRAPLQLSAERYQRMADYFSGIGPHGARMMRQTASLQLCIGGAPLSRWRAANAIAPWLVALFANSSRHAGADTGCASYRAETWRGVDPLRTGLLQGCDPVGEYAAFALRAPAFLAGGPGAPAVPFGVLADDVATDDALATHLSTLFPEVRPRGYLELRSMDSVDPSLHAAAMVFAAGILCDGVASARALELVGDPNAALLRQAGRCGLADPVIGRHAGDLVELAVRGCARQGERIVSAALLEYARDVLIGRVSPAPVWRYSSSPPMADLGPELR
jgi:glutamate--cysteine ligase